MGKQKQAKQGQGDGPPPVPNRDLFHRVHFAHQTAAYLTSLAGPSTSSRLPVRVDRKGKRKAIDIDQSSHKSAERSTGDHDGGIGDSFGIWGRSARMGIGESRMMIAHNQLKIDPSLNRTICKVCSTVLIPGITSKVRNKPSRNHFHKINHTCLTCQEIRSFPAPPSLDTSSPSSRIGPNRRKRIEKHLKRVKIPFHEKERMEAANEAEAASGLQTLGKVHGQVLWKGDERVHNWGSTISGIEAK